MRTCLCFYIVSTELRGVLSMLVKQTNDKKTDLKMLDNRSREDHREKLPGGSLGLRDVNSC